MSSYKNSFDELYEEMFRGNEIEFIYNGESYFLLPEFDNTVVIGVFLGKFGDNNESLYLSKQELYNAKIEDRLFGEILSQIDIVWNNFAP